MRAAPGASLFSSEAIRALRGTEQHPQSLPTRCQKNDPPVTTTKNTSKLFLVYKSHISVISQGEAHFIIHQ